MTVGDRSLDLVRFMRKAVYEVVGGTSEQVPLIVTRKDA